MMGDTGARARLREKLRRDDRFNANFVVVALAAILFLGAIVMGFSRNMPPSNADRELAEATTGSATGAKPPRR